MGGGIRGWNGTPQKVAGPLWPFPPTAAVDSFVNHIKTSINHYLHTKLKMAIVTSPPFDDPVRLCSFFNTLGTPLVCCQSVRGSWTYNSRREFEILFETSRSICLMGSSAQQRNTIFWQPLNDNHNVTVSIWNANEVHKKDIICIGFLGIEKVNFSSQFLM